MKLRDLVLVLCGIGLGLFALRIYGWLKPKPQFYYYENARPASFNDEVSKQRQNAIVVAAQRVSPSVVSITVIQTKVVPASPFFSPYADDFFRDFFGDFLPERYYRQQVRSLGTGLIISPDGYVVTNEHVVSNATRINITLPDSRQFEGKVVAVDVTHDLALLKVDGEKLPYVELGDSDDLMIGEWVVAFGNPFGFLLEDTRPTVTVGVVSALNRSIKSTQEDRIYKNMIQTDAAINPGNSGGPLVNILGEVIGLNTAIFTSGGGSEGIGFARPINEVKKFVSETREHGRVRMPWIGIWIKEITPDIASALNIEQYGVMVNSVDENSAAWKSGIRSGDRIIGINGNTIARMSDWNRFVSGIFVGDKLDIALVRGKDTLNVAFTVEESKQADLEKTRVVAYGIHVDDITERLARQYNLSYREGAVVTEIDANSSGAKLGIVPGDVILMVGNMRIHNRIDFQQATKYQHDMSIIIDRNGRIIQFYLGL
jgi:serine protease Do